MVVCIEAFFKPVDKMKTVKVPTGETKPDLFGGVKGVARKEVVFKQTGWSDCEIEEPTHTTIA